MVESQEKSAHPIAIYLKDRKEFFALIGESINFWSSIETLIFELFCISLDTKVELSKSIFWSIPNFGMRLSYTSDLIGIILKTDNKDPAKQHKNASEKEWISLNNRLILNYKTRNLLAHQPRSDEIMREISDGKLGSLNLLIEVSAKFAIRPNMHDPKQNFSELDIEAIKSYLLEINYIQNHLANFIPGFVKARASKYP